MSGPHQDTTGPTRRAGDARDHAVRLLRAAVRRGDDPRATDRLARRAVAILDESRAARRAEAARLAHHRQEIPPTMSRKLVAEFIGTLWLVLGGCGAAVLAAKFPEVGIGLVGVSLAFGLTVLTMAYAIGHISGCHLNPAVTLGLVAAGRFKASEAPGYIAAQVAGGVVGAALLLLIASGKAGFDAASGFATNGFAEASPGGYGLASSLVTEVAMTFFFLIIILGATSERAPKGFAPIAIGLGLTLIHLISIPVTNTSVNPARSTGVALFGPEGALSQLWLFWVAPIAGAVLAGIVHQWLGAEDSAADRDAAAAQARSRMDEALAPATAREPR